MIELNTGVPGAGKTLNVVQRLAKTLERWEKHPTEARPVFVHNIPDLAIGHCALPLKEWEPARGKPRVMVPDWEALPPGALVVIDECQCFFPPRPAGSEAPPHVAFLNVHRHKGLDIWLTTQHPRLIDTGVRALVGRHRHFRRMFGGARAVIYEWDSCSDTLAGFKHAVTSYWPYPRAAFGWYKSAEVHTKQQYKLPKWLAVPVLGVVLCAVFFPKAYAVITGSGAAQKKPEPVPVRQSVAPLPLPVAASGVPVAASSVPVSHVVAASAVMAEKDAEPVGAAFIAKYKRAPGVYSDSPYEAALTDEQRERRERSEGGWRRLDEYYSGVRAAQRSGGDGEI